LKFSIAKDYTYTILNPKTYLQIHTDKDYYDMDDQTTANDECGICLEALTAAITLPCNHKFCADCLHGWKSKFGDYRKEEKSKSCPLCRKKIPPSKDMLSQLDYHRKLKLALEAKGDTTSDEYINQVEQIKELEKEIGTYDGAGLDYDGYMDLPKYIYDAVKNNDHKNVMDWLGSPVDKKRLNARYPGYVNTTLVHMAINTDSSDLLSILLQYGADVNALDAKGYSPFIYASLTTVTIDMAKILLEWGAEIILPRSVSDIARDRRLSNIEAFIQAVTKKTGNTKLTNLLSSEFGGRRCEVINLPNHPQLNGKTCVVEKYITKKDRYKVIFEGSGNAALVGPNNLKRRDRTPLDCGYYISFKDGRMSRREFATKEECQEYVTSLGGGGGDVKETAEDLANLKI